MLPILHIPSIFNDCVIGVGQGGKRKGDFWVGVGAVGCGGSTCVSAVIAQRVCSLIKSALIPKLLIIVVQCFAWVTV